MKGSITQRSKGSWTIRVDIGKDENGKRKQKTWTVRGTKKEAQADLARVLNELNTGQYVEPTRMTVAEYLEKWLEDYAKSNVDRQTYALYERRVRIHLIPALGHHRLARLKATEDSVKPPRAQNAKMRVLTREESALVLEKAKGSDLFIPVLLALTTGTRIGEICGLNQNNS